MRAKMAHSVMRFGPWLGLLGSCAALAFALAVARPTAAQTLRPAVVGGAPSPVDRDAAVLLVYRAPSGEFAYTCSAALVAPNLIVTARHCVSAIDDYNVACEADGRQASGSAVGVDRSAERFEVYAGAARPLPSTPSAAKGKSIHHDGAKSLCGHDLAFIVLDRDVPAARVVPIRMEGPVSVGERFTAVGYGVTKTAAEPPARQERSAVAIRQVGPFEGADREPPVAPRDFLVGESFCQGDSGGPAISDATGAVIGVATRVTNLDSSATAPWDLCVESARAPRVYAYYTQMGAFASLTRSAFAAAGREPWLEGRSQPGYPADEDGCRVGPAHGGKAPGALLLVVAMLLGRRFSCTARRSLPWRIGKRR